MRPSRDIDPGLLVRYIAIKNLLANYSRYAIFPRGFSLYIPLIAPPVLEAGGASLMRDPTLAKYWRSARLLSSSRCAGLDHPQR